MSNREDALTYRRIFFFWTPLAATWLMMATEGPFLAAVIARLAEPKINLAAYGVAFSFAVLIEAPIIMIMSASTALVADKASYCKLRNFTFALNAIITGLMILIVIPPVFRLITLKLIGLPQEVARLTHLACIIMLPWPGAIGYRRFYQGILIRHNLTRRVAYGTAVRLLTMATVALLGYSLLTIPGALVGALALGLAVCAEAAATRLMAHATIKSLLTNVPPSPPADPLSYRYITRFYYPLALTSVLALGVYPIVTFFMGQSRMALESLAALPVIQALVFIFRSMGLSYQEVSIALLGENNQGYRQLRNFALVLAFLVSLALALISFSPLVYFWFQKVSGLSPALAQFAVLPTRILCLIPALSVLLSFQRSLLVAKKRTSPITIATLIEILAIIAVLTLTLHVLGLVGAVGAALALALGRTLSNAYLLRPCFQSMSLSREK